jgi:integrase
MNTGAQTKFYLAIVVAAYTYTPFSSECRELITGLADSPNAPPLAIRSKMFRHAYYTAARLQTLDHGSPVSAYMVARELGHGGEAMLRRVYGHLGQVRYRADVVAYRVEQHIRRSARGLAPPLASRG